MNVSEGATPAIHYKPPATGQFTPLILVYRGPPSRRFVFYDRLEIGRFHVARAHHPGLLLIDDPMVSARHCTLSRTVEGGCVIRDISRNGTRLDGRRLVPNLEVELQPGQILNIGGEVEFLLEGEFPLIDMASVETSGFQDEEPAVVTVLVGDMSNYTELVQGVHLGVTHSVTRVFQAIEHEVARLGGTIKECQGDAIIAFWEASVYPDHAHRACQAALNLRRLCRALATDPSVWSVEDFELRLDWALATGLVLVYGFGGSHAAGLTMVGEPMVKAHRLEKLVEGPERSILVCQNTYDQARTAFDFQDMGTRELKGFHRPEPTYALIKSLTQDSGGSDA